jgi:hypothetical protein
MIVTRFSANLLLLLAAAFWGYGNIAQKTVLEHLDPFSAMLDRRAAHAALRAVRTSIATEQLTQHAHREEEGRTRRYPSACVRRDAAARHDHGRVRMVGHRRTPGVEYGGDADVRTEMLPIRSVGRGERSPAAYGSPCPA